MAKSAVNERKLFEIPALLCCEQGYSAENKPGIIQIIYVLWISSSYILFLPIWQTLFQNLLENSNVQHS